MGRNTRYFVLVALGMFCVSQLFLIGVFINEFNSNLVAFLGSFIGGALTFGGVYLTLKLSEKKEGNKHKRMYKQFIIILTH